VARDNQSGKRTTEADECVRKQVGMARRWGPVGNRKKDEREEVTISENAHLCVYAVAVKGGV